MASKLFERLVKTQRLPSPSATALRVLEMADREDASLVEVCDALAADPSMSAKILKFANSPLVGSRREVTSLRQAVMLLGLRTVKVTALSFSLVSERDFSRCPHFHFDQFWAHAAATATAARGVMAAREPEARDEAFVAGLLSRLGKLAFVTAIPEEYDRVLKRAGGVMRAALDEEREAFGTDHVEVGAELLARWKLPPLLVEAVRNQTRPAAVTDERVRRLAEAIQRGQEIADGLVWVVAGDESAGVGGLAPEQTAKLVGEFRDLASLLKISLNELPSPDELEQRARELMTELSVAAQAENDSIRARKRELEAQVLLDPLTRVGNRGAFETLLASEMERTRRHGPPLSLLMLDIDRFKAVNDTHGHPVGDAVLRAVAGVLSASVRKCDAVARYGGEEFAVIAPETDADAVRQLAERVREAIAGCEIPTLAGRMRVTVSVGVATVVPPAPVPDSEALVQAADRELYRAKQAGRNRCCFSVVEPSGAAAAVGAR